MIHICVMGELGLCAIFGDSKGFLGSCELRHGIGYTIKSENAPRLHSVKNISVCPDIANRRSGEIDPLPHCDDEMQSCSWNNPSIIAEERHRPEPSNIINYNRDHPPVFLLPCGRGPQKGKPSPSRPQLTCCRLTVRVKSKWKRTSVSKLLWGLGSDAEHWWLW